MYVCIRGERVRMCMYIVATIYNERHWRPRIQANHAKARDLAENKIKKLTKLKC